MFEDLKKIPELSSVKDNNNFYETLEINNNLRKYRKSYFENTK